MSEGSTGTHGSSGPGRMEGEAVPSGHPKSSPSNTFYSKGGALRRLSHTCKDVLKQMGAKGLHQPNSGCALPFSQGRWGDPSRWKQERKIKLIWIKFMRITKSNLTNPREWLLIWMVTKMKDPKRIFPKSLSWSFRNMVIFKMIDVLELFSLWAGNTFYLVEKHWFNFNISI